MASNNNKRPSVSTAGSNSVTRSNSATRTPVNQVASRPVTVRPAAPVRPPVATNPVLVASYPVERRREPTSLNSMASGHVPSDRPPVTPPKAPDPTPPKRAVARVSNLRLDPPRAKPVSTKKSTSPASSATPRDDKTKLTCKARPTSNKPAPKGGGGGSMKRFIPWCG